MCHCFGELTEMDADEQAKLIEEHSATELREEYSQAELETLGVAG